MHIVQICNENYLQDYFHICHIYAPSDSNTRTDLQKNIGNIIMYQKRIYTRFLQIRQSSSKLFKW